MMTVETVESGLKKVKDKKSPVIVRIDENVIYRRVVQVLDLLQRYDLND